MVKLVATAVAALMLVVASSAAAEPAVSRQGSLPKRGVLVVGKSLAGVQLGQTQERVRQLWGSKFDLCPKDACKDPTWLYFLAPGSIAPGVDPVHGVVGAAVRFRNNKAVAVFTLGATLGWRTTEGLKVADPSSRVAELYGEPTYKNCIGYQAFSLRGGANVTTIYLTSGVVYGFALTSPGLPVCQ
jgi:hypothetical protein